MLERAIRAVVIASTLVAAAWELDLASRDWSPILRAGELLFAVFALAAAFWGRRVVGWLFAPGCLVPVLLVAVSGRFRAPLLIVWLMPLLGALVATSRDGGFAFPARMKLPLALWALVIALSWPVVVLRESDFYLPIFFRSVPLSGIGNTPAHAAAWTINVALTHLTGLLLFDWFCRHYAREPLDRFVREIVWPMAPFVLLAAALGAYQGLLDVKWMAAGQWPAINRAGGSLVDGNPSGMFVALWSTLFLPFVFNRTRFLKIFGLTGTTLTWVAAAASGSRTAVLAGIIGLSVFAWIAARGSRDGVSRRSLLSAAAAILIAGAVCGALLRTNGVIARMRASLPSATRDSIAYFLRYQFWDRNGPYGTAAVHMLQDSPLVGVGVGSFHTLVPDYSYPINKYYVRSDPDNAQNWFRHQLAELGLLGSLGWIAWCVLIVQLARATRVSASNRLEEGAVRGALIALAVVSLVAMPTQNTVLTLLFWTLAFWWIALRTADDRRDVVESRGPGAAAWALTGLLALAFLALTVQKGLGEFRPEMRAVRFDWHYIYGFYETEFDERGLSFRWTQSRGVDVVSATAPLLKLEIRANHADIAAKPMEVKVWCNQNLVFDRTLSTGERTVAVVPVPPGEKRVALRTWSSRTERPADFGSTDTRSLGFMIRAEFVSAPPAAGRPGE
jgi:hypothetical protein